MTHQSENPATVRPMSIDAAYEFLRRALHKGGEAIANFQHSEAARVIENHVLSTPEKWPTQKVLEAAK